MSQSLPLERVRRTHKSNIFAIMADECVNEHVLCFVFVDANVDVLEEFRELYYCPDIAADTIASLIRYTL